MEDTGKELSPEEKLAEKLRRQKMQEESDLELAKEAFGITDSELSTKEELDELKNSLVTKILQQQVREFVKKSQKLTIKLTIKLLFTEIFQFCNFFG